MADPYLGEIRAFAGSYAPEDWVLCDGSMLSVSTYQALFAVLGTTYGGDGVSTFGVPDLRGRIISGDGQLTGGQNYPLGSKGGVEEVALQVANMPAHSHTFNVNSAPGTLNNATNNYLAAAVDVANPSYTVNIYQAASSSNTPTPVQWADNAVSQTIGTVGMPHDNMQPYLTISYIMCVVGLFPSQT